MGGWLHVSGLLSPMSKIFKVELEMGPDFLSTIMLSPPHTYPFLVFEAAFGPLAQMGSLFPCKGRDHGVHSFTLSCILLLGID